MLYVHLLTYTTQYEIRHSSVTTQRVKLTGPASANRRPCSKCESESTSPPHPLPPCPAPPFPLPPQREVAPLKPARESGGAAENLEHV